ncbi:MAG: SDR family NAD(P)-dependent oxidoreductase [Pseudomonadales bacterium]|nr:SDR family NAD(P)-dependent oxidoreductase [Pseudomonadales bacterium]
MNNPQVKESGANAVGHKNVVTAVATAIFDMFSNKGQMDPLPDDVRIDGKTCLVTGANSGLGKAVAIDLAKKGGRVIMACRGGHPEAGEEVKLASGNQNVEMIKVDLSDIQSVEKLCDDLRDRNVQIDIAVLNAGLMPLNARKSPQGFELMFAVHFLANRLLLERWTKDGVIRPNTDRDKTPRVIFVSSEAHQSSDPIDFNHFGEFNDYGIKEGLKYYGLSKLHLCLFANELSRRLNPEGETQVAVHSLCPGPIASNIARESPAYLKPILSPIMKAFFRSPEQAAEPVIYLACAKDMGERSGVYLHMMREKNTSVDAQDESSGSLLWEKSADLLSQHTQEPVSA